MIQTMGQRPIVWDSLHVKRRLAHMVIVRSCLRTPDDCILVTGLESIVSLSSWAQNSGFKFCGVSTEYGVGIWQYPLFPIYARVHDGFTRKGDELPRSVRRNPSSRLAHFSLAVILWPGQDKFILLVLWVSTRETRRRIQDPSSRGK